MKIGRRIFFDNRNGDILLDTGEKSGDVTPMSAEMEINTYRKLTNRNRDTFDYIELEYGQYREDFLHATSYRVNPKTKELVFSYDKIDEETEPIYQEPLTEKVERLEKEKEELKVYTAALGQTLTEEKITNIQKDMLLQGLGQEVTALKIELITLKGGE